MVTRREPSRSEERRVVITGLGVIAANGLTVEKFWDTLRRGVSGVKPTTRYDVSKLPVKVSAEIHGFKIEEHLNAVKLNRLELSVQYGLAASAQAVRDSKLDVAEIDPDRIGIVEGTTTSGVTQCAQGAGADAGQARRSIPTMPSAATAAKAAAPSASSSASTAMRSPTAPAARPARTRIGYAWRTVKDDDVDMMIAGGSDAMFEAQHFGFCRLRAMSELEGPPGTQMRPFDETRDGFILGEGAAYFVVEELGHALSRGANIYAEIVAHGRSAESYHPTDPHPDGGRLHQCHAPGHAPRAAARAGGRLHQCARLGDAAERPARDQGDQGRLRHPTPRASASAPPNRSPATPWARRARSRRRSAPWPFTSRRCRRRSISRHPPTAAIWTTFRKAAAALSDQCGHESQRRIRRTLCVPDPPRAIPAT